MVGIQAVSGPPVLFKGNLMGSAVASYEVEASGVEKQEPTPEPVMARWEQYEIHQMNGTKWELLGAFADLELAKTMARNRATRMRLVRAVYEDGKLLEQDVIADLGATRDVA